MHPLVGSLRVDPMLELRLCLGQQLRAFLGSHVDCMALAPVQEAVWEHVLRATELKNNTRFATQVRLPRATRPNKNKHRTRWRMKTIMFGAAPTNQLTQLKNT